MTQALDKEEFGELVDSRLEDNFIPSEMFRMIEAAAACVRHLASKRPKMSQVISYLSKASTLMHLIFHMLNMASLLCFFISLCR